MTLVALAVAAWLGAWALNARLAASRSRRARALVPLIFGATVLVLWEMAVRAWAVSRANWACSPSCLCNAAYIAFHLPTTF